MQLRTGELSVRAKFQTICIDAMKDCDNIVTYFNRLQAAGFDLEITTQDEGRISGLVFHLNGDTMKASDLGKAFTFNGLTKKAGLSYDKNRDFEYITEIQNATALKHFRAAGGDLTIDQLSVSGAHGASITASSVGNEPASDRAGSNRSHIGNRDGQRLGQDRHDEQNSERIQRAPASQPIAIKPDLGDSNPSYQRAIDLISDLADATSIATNYKREGFGAANQRPASANYAARSAQIKALGGRYEEFQISILLPEGAKQIKGRYTFDPLTPEQQAEEDAFYSLLENKDKPRRTMFKRTPKNAEDFQTFAGFCAALNANDADIYIAPHPLSQHSFVLIDDLTIENVNRMKADGLEPSLLIESSPNNFQSWLKLSDSDKPLSKEQRLECSRLLTNQYHGDVGAIGSVRIGRLAGFTNRKAKHKNAQGLQPYCQLKENRQEPATNGHLIVEQANELIANGTASTERKKRFSAIENARDYLGYGANSVQFFQTEAKKIFNRYKDETDVSKLDSMVCKTMVQHHFSDVQIAHALREASPDLATRHSVEDYIARTVSYARNYIEMQRQLQESEDAATDDHTL